MPTAKARTAIPSPQRRRTQDEMHAALRVLNQHIGTLHANHDDEHIPVLEDTVMEVLHMRTVLSVFLQRIDAARLEALTSLENILK